MKSIERLELHKRVDYIDDERFIGNGIIVTLKRYTIDQVVPTHVFSEDTVTAALEKVRNSYPCKCEDCSVIRIKTVQYQ